MTRFIAFLVVLVLGTGPLPAQDLFENSELTIETETGRHDFSIELALTPEARARGLMFREALAPDAGMLFVYPRKGRVSMWMKNTAVSLDMLFLDSNGEILHLAERTTPQSTKVISSRRRVKAVLELLAGTAQRVGIKVGDKVHHESLSGP